MTADQQLDCIRRVNPAWIDIATGPQDEHALYTNAAQFNEMDDNEWRLVRDYLHHVYRANRKYCPRNRIAWISGGVATTRAAAQQWWCVRYAKANRDARKPAPSEYRSALPGEHNEVVTRSEPPEDLKAAIAANMAAIREMPEWRPAGQDE